MVGIGICIGLYLGLNLHFWGVILLIIFSKRGFWQFFLFPMLGLIPIQRYEGVYLEAKYWIFFALDWVETNISFHSWSVSYIKYNNCVIIINLTSSIFLLLQNLGATTDENENKPPLSPFLILSPKMMKMKMNHLCLLF